MDVKLQSDIYDKLKQLAGNLWWSWQPEVSAIFRDLNPARFRELNHNPISLLKEYTPDDLEKLARESVLHSRINWAYRRWIEYLESTETWGETHTTLLRHRPVAYFSAEFGIHESVPIYSGGLGILSGDHLKSASDLDVPLVAIGLLYQEGYFAQTISRDGRQEETYNKINIDELPIKPAVGRDGQEVIISVQTRSG
ncbi:MAG TPA: DUF3417 domain-containing protein, partial [Planctomycetaceae bacterium]|nr:DUF3417 domain-containing protein [Planctomycetaceae bacterium]